MCVTSFTSICEKLSNASAPVTSDDRRGISTYIPAEIKNGCRANKGGIRRAEK